MNEASCQTGMERFTIHIGRKKVLKCVEVNQHRRRLHINETFTTGLKTLLSSLLLY